MLSHNELCNYPCLSPEMVLSCKHVLMGLRTVAYDDGVTTHKQHQEHAGIHPASNMNSPCGSSNPEQRAPYQKFTLPSDTIALSILSTRNYQ